MARTADPRSSIRGRKRRRAAPSAERRPALRFGNQVFSRVVRRLYRERYFFFEEDFFPGTLPPSRRASESPIAIACLRLVTFFPDRPLFSVPRLRSCIAFSTFSEALLPYRAMATSTGSPRMPDASLEWEGSSETKDPPGGDGESGEHRARRSDADELGRHAVPPRRRED